MTRVINVLEKNPMKSETGKLCLFLILWIALRSNSFSYFVRQIQAEINEAVYIDLSDVPSLKSKS